MRANAVHQGRAFGALFAIHADLDQSVGNEVALDFGQLTSQPDDFDVPPAFGPSAARLPDDLRAKIKQTLADKQRASRIPEKLRAIFERLLRQ